MKRTIFLIDSGDQLVEMRERAYDSEDLLQGLLATHPNLLAGDQIDRMEPKRWLLITREAGIPGEAGGSGRWSVDHLFLDQNAVPTLIEVKRSTDTRIRREVVGQMLDYAANAVVYWPVDHLRARFETSCRDRGLASESVLSDFLGPEADPEAFWQQVKTNLQAGKIRLIFVADEIPSELRRIVEFLNQQMDPAEVLAVEIKQYAGKGLRTLVPTIIGQTAEAEQRKGSAATEKRQWDEPTFFEHLASEHSEQEVAVARHVLEWAQSRTNRIWWGKGKTEGSFVPTIEHKGTDHQLFAIWSKGRVEIYFYWYAYKAPFDDEAKRMELLNKLSGIDGLSFTPAMINRRPSFPLAVLVDENNLQRFFEVFDWFLESVRAV